MLRIPPSSIDLSEQDVNFHLQQVDIYYGLLKQGFKKSDIIRHMRKDNPKKQSGRSSEVDDLSAASMVDLAHSRSTLPVAHVSPAQSDDAESARAPDDSGVAESFKIEQSCLEDIPSATDVPLQGPSCHTPRQSSLLRFTELASPPTPEGSTEQTDSVYRPAPGIITYRPRTDTYSYDESECSKTDLVNPEVQTGSSDDLSPLAGHTVMRAEAPDFVPQDQQYHGDNVSIHEENTVTAIPSTPPTAGTDSPNLLRICFTPHRSHRSVRGAFRREQNHQTDGPFSVYNDALPAVSQPQTPAEIDPRLLLEAHGMAYTAPPGMLGSPRLAHHQHMLDSMDLGSQSPIARAISARERRARELRRSIRIEADRLDSRTVSTEEGANVGAEVTAMHTWRNQLEAARVGDENWEIETILQDRFDRLRLRTISGNTTP